MSDRVDFRSLLAPRIRAAGVCKTAHRIGIAHSSLIAWMAGRRGMSVATLERLLANFSLAVRLEDAKAQPPQTQRAPPRT